MFKIPTVLFSSLPSVFNCVIPPPLDIIFLKKYCVHFSPSSISCSLLLKIIPLLLISVRTDISLFTSLISSEKSYPWFKRLKYLCSLFCSPIMCLFSLSFLSFPILLKKVFILVFTISHQSAHES
ncbi:hypothetical protein PGIGA_G00237560 [Pangasianodon gigas]|uniref:Uncharacterized protein n=1 Tax=Pangasianodon gigas TaxID=30993 RepID=A0ACC5WMJ8_PANGG|nr:hypothetical protein [Pangasianodon gigas]